MSSYLVTLATNLTTKLKHVSPVTTYFSRSRLQALVENFSSFIPSTWLRAGPHPSSFIFYLLPLAFLLVFYFYPMLSIFKYSFAPAGVLDLLALEKLFAGMTTPEEVLRVTQSAAV